MKNEIRIVGFDPALANWGIADCRYNLDTEQLYVDDIDLVKTEAYDKKSNIRKSSHEISRGKKIYDVVKTYIDSADFVVAEVPHGSRGADAAVARGIVIGILASIETPLFEVSQDEVKMTMLARSSATKREMYDAVIRKVANASDIPWRKTRKANGVGDNEHMSDAIASVFAAIQTNEFQRLISIYKAAARNAA